MMMSTGKAEIRADFIKRLFAVAVSVGFASTVSKMEWITEQSLPTTEEINELIVLSMALMATFLSWDGYLASINRKPLNDTPRFWIDIVLVFVYMLLLLTASSNWLWLPLLCLVFTLYVIWDVLSIRLHYSKFVSEETGATVPENGAEFRVRLPTVGKVYLYPFIGRKEYKAGPLISLMWAGYFFGMLYISAHFPSLSGNSWMCFFAMAGLMLYRDDKHHCYSTLKRLSVIFFVLAVLSTILYINQVNQTFI